MRGCYIGQSEKIFKGGDIWGLDGEEEEWAQQDPREECSNQKEQHVPTSKAKARWVCWKGWKVVYIDKGIHWGLGEAGRARSFRIFSHGKEFRFYASGMWSPLRALRGRSWFMTFLIALVAEWRMNGSDGQRVGPGRLVRTLLQWSWWESWQGAWARDILQDRRATVGTCCEHRVDMTGSYVMDVQVERRRLKVLRWSYPKVLVWATKWPWVHVV